MGENQEEEIDELAFEKLARSSSFYSVTNSRNFNLLLFCFVPPRRTQS
jgi:hypothetical protein